jgi:hypothetical protein
LENLTSKETLVKEEVEVWLLVGLDNLTYLALELNALLEEPYSIRSKMLPLSNVLEEVA